MVVKVPKGSDFQRSPPRVVRSLVIAEGETVSEDVEVRGETLVGVVFPFTWTPADLYFQVSFDDGLNWHDCYSSTGVRVKITGVVPEGYHAVNAAPLMGISKIRLVSSVAQTADVLLTMILLN
ncbi:hypothetical protein [Hyphomicrobium sp. ghe19]|uniref:hypothetical protein n=1 Tax=Hyphomicrobium sp. ghe19 TaxID=2682968 RepID=UPI00136729EA|nr:hypothetical protein HYPP_02417 [Hyphomicrobium sp. ghe19]